MNKKVYVDNDAYVARILTGVEIDIPNRKEVPYARLGLKDLFTLFYECPLGSNLKRRYRSRFARQWMIETVILITKIGYLPYVKQMKEFGHSFLKGHAFRTDGSCNFTLPPDATGNLIGTPLASAVKAYTHLVNSSSVYSEYLSKIAQWILTCHVYLSKAPLTRPDLEELTRDKWVDIQENHVKDISDMNMDYVLALRAIVSWLFDESLLTEELLGKHGPGNTNNGAKTVPEKEDSFVPTLQAELICPTGHTYYFDEPDMAVYASVDKDSGARRSITQESVPMMYAQQALKRKIYEHTDRGHVNLSWFVKFSDQTRSREAALRASVFRPRAWDRLVTADLSFASDLVSSDLVAFVFSGDILHQLMLSRTWHVIYSDTQYLSPKMFAGMGAATTFPVQTIIFTAIAILSLAIQYQLETYGGIQGNPESGLYGDAVRELLSEPRTKQNLKYGFWSHLKRIRVYGDDIIVQDKALPWLKSILTSLGLRLNVDKTFGGTDAVRESCGIYALSGWDITPLRYRIPLHQMGEPVDSAVYEAYRQLANRAYCFGYRRLSRRLVRLYEELVPFHNTRKAKKTWYLVNGHDERMVQLMGGVYEFRGRNVEYVRATKPQPLYEPFRGSTATYLGIISYKTSETSRAIIHGYEQEYTLSWTSRTVTTRDHDHENYYYQQNLYECWNNSSESEEAATSGHGSVPRGVRLELKIARRVEHGETSWAWVPTVAG